jgi:cysteinyl-tRNA synthetase
LLQADAGDFLKSQAGQGEGLSDTAIDDLVSARFRARSEKDWARADRIRDELVDAGIVIEDGSDGTRWRRA